MQPYEDLDAFRVSHELTLAVHRTVARIQERDPDLASQLWGSALWCSGRIVRGSAFGNRRMFAMSLDRAVAALTELGYYLSLGQALGLVTEEEYREIESMRAERRSIPASC
jgi:four helix bundle protein